MRFNDHSRYADSHALLSPSKHSWINYDEDKLDAMVTRTMAARRGTQLHELAQRLISLRVNLPKTNDTLNRYVNDCIGYKLTPEQTVFYSPNCFGHADALGFRKKLLQVFDLKTGVTEASFDQLLVYSALFCLEYNVRPTDIEMEMRIYQNDDVKIALADPLDVMSIMDKIIFFDKRLEERKAEVNE